jgi:hypothetical protein
MNLLILRLSIDKASEALKESLDGYSALADRAYGSALSRPGSFSVICRRSERGN